MLKNQILSKPNPHNAKQITLLYVMCIIVGSLILYANALHNTFLNNWDDNAYVINNFDIRSLKWHNIKELFSSFYVSNYQPVTMLSYAIDYHLFGLDSFYFHLTNLLSHIANAILLFVFIKQLTKNIHTAFITALLFAVHPMHVESVVWIAERKDMIFSFFFLLSLTQYMQFRKHRKTIYIVLSFISFVLSLLSKSAAVCLPLVLVLIDYYFEKKLSFAHFYKKTLFFVSSIVIGVVAIVSQKSSGAVLDVSYAFSIFDRLFFFTYTCSFYIIKTILPFHLSALHYYPLKTAGFLPIEYYLSLPFVALIVWGILKLKALKHEIIFGTLFYLITIFLVLQLFPVGNAIVSERYSYIPYIGLFYIVACLYNYLIYSSNIISNTVKKQLPFILAGIVIVFCVITIQRNAVWKDCVSLFSDVTEKNPDGSFGWGALGESYSNNNDTTAALSAFNRAVSLNTKNPEQHFNRGVFFTSIGNYENALVDFDASIALNPSYADAYSNRGFVYLTLQKYNKAFSDLTKALQLKPNCSEAFYNRGNVYFYTQKLVEAKADYTKAIEHNGYYADAYYNRGIVHYMLQNNAGACNDWNVALSLGSTAASEKLNSYCQ